MTYVPFTHDEVPPTCVVYENVPEDVTVWIEESSTVKEPWSWTSMRTVSENSGAGLIVPEML
jgi:hypothetical protein